MVNQPAHGRRRATNRAEGFDYSLPGWYYVTICTHQLHPVFGDVVEGEMVLNDAGRVATEMWHGLPERFDHIDLDAFVLMPNHLHGIIVINETTEPMMDGRNPNLVRAQFIAPDTRRGPTHDASNQSALTGKGAINCARTNPKALGNIVRVFKAVTTDRVRRSGTSDFRWHRNYYDHIIRDERDLDRVRAYIAGNPGNWAFDRANTRKETIPA